MAGLIRLFYAPLCHQIPERSFQLWGDYLPVCARCTGIYLGFFIGSVVFPFIKNKIETVYPSRNLLLIALIPMGSDVGLNWLFHIDSGLLIHSLTGLMFSFIFSFYAIPGIMELSDLLIKKGEMSYGKTTQ